MAGKRILKITLVGVLAVALLYGAAWAATAAVILQQSQHWLAKQRERGAQISYGEPYFTGFFNAPVVNFPAVAIMLPPGDGGWTWQTARVGLSAVPWAIRDLHIDLAGDHTITGPWTVAPLHFTAEAAAALLRLDAGGKLTDAKVETGNTAIRWHGGDGALAQLTRGLISVVLQEPQKEGSLQSSRLTVELDNVELPNVIPAPISRTLRRLRVVTDLKGEAPSGPLPAVLEAWRSAGGDVELREVWIDWPPISVAGSGTLALDDALQPMGAFTLKVGGFFAAVDGLVVKGLVRPADASMAKIVLGLLAKVPAGGGPPELSLAFTVQDRMLQVGPVRLMEMPAITWPEKLIVP